MMTNIRKVVYDETLSLTHSLLHKCVGRCSTRTLVWNAVYRRCIIRGIMYVWMKTIEEV